MKVLDSLDINLRKENIISLVGAGGKSSTMYRLSKEIKANKKKVLITTTTAIFYPFEDQYDYIIVSKNFEETIKELKKIPDETITVLGSSVIEDSKLKGISKEWVDLIYQKKLFDCILVEADGSKRRPIKAPAYYEPVVPDSTNILIGVIGFDCYGKIIEERWVHRPEILIDIANKNLGSVIDKDVIVKLVLAKDGLFKNSPQKSSKSLLLNKILDERSYQEAKLIGNIIIQKNAGIKKVLIGCVKESDPIKIVLE